MRWKGGSCLSKKKVLISHSFQTEIFSSELDEVADDFSEDYLSVKVLPELLKSVEFGGGGPRVFSAVVKIGSKLSDEDFNLKLTPVVVRLFSNPDRAIRVCLLDNLPKIIGYLPQKLVNDKIFPHMVRFPRTVLHRIDVDDVRPLGLPMLRL